jgi:hypothetical protein
MGLLSGIDKRIGDLLSDVNKSPATRLEIAGPVLGRVTFAHFRLKPAAATARHDYALLCYC